VPATLAGTVLERAEGNPLFVEETVRMLVESRPAGRAGERVPDTLQALIAARLDQLPPAAKALLQRAAVIGRVFWRGALEHLAPDLEDTSGLLDDLLQRELLLREARSSISGDVAYRFKHVLIREVAYGSLAKLARARYHRRFAEWLAERTGEELIEIRAHHLGQAVDLLTELEGAPPEELAEEAATALVKAAKRALARESYANARALGLRAVELRPTLGARYAAARAAWRMQDWAAVEVEMEKVREQAGVQGETVLEALALTALGEVALRRHGDPAAARSLEDRALEILRGEQDSGALFEALVARATVAAWVSELDEVVGFLEQAYQLALGAGRPDLQTTAAQALAQIHLVRLELDEAERLSVQALGLAGESKSLRARTGATLTYASLLAARGELDEAETLLEEVRTSAAELGVEPAVAAALGKLAWIARRRGERRQAEKLLREALRILTARGDRGPQPELRAALAETLADLGKIDEAERLALEAAAGAGAEDVSARVAAAAALGAVRAAQGREEEAEEHLASADSLARESGFRLLELEPAERLARLLRERGRDEEAARYEARVAELSLPSSTARIA